MRNGVLADVVDVLDLLKQRMVRKALPSGSGLSAGLRIIGDARIGGEVSRVEGGYSLGARLAWRGSLECSRCLAPYDFVHDERFSLLLYPRVAVASPELALAREDLDASFYDDPVVPVAPIVEERIQMAIPMKPLCREDCRGLCPRCGSDLNVSECSCVVEEVDPRWRALQLLKKE